MRHVEIEARKADRTEDQYVARSAAEAAVRAAVRSGFLVRLEAPPRGRPSAYPKIPQQPDRSSRP